MINPMNKIIKTVMIILKIILLIFIITYIPISNAYSNDIKLPKDEKIIFSNENYSVYCNGKKYNFTTFTNAKVEGSGSIKLNKKNTKVNRDKNIYSIMLTYVYTDSGKPCAMNELKNINSLEQREIERIEKGGGIRNKVSMIAINAKIKKYKLLTNIYYSKDQPVMDFVNAEWDSIPAESEIDNAMKLIR